MHMKLVLNKIIYATTELTWSSQKQSKEERHFKMDMSLK